MVLFGWLIQTSLGTLGAGVYVGEALRMPAVGVIKDVLPRCLEFIGQAMVDGVGVSNPRPP